MKVFIALFVCALAATVLARPEINKEEAEASKLKLKQAHEKCQSDPATAIDEDAVKNLRKGGAPPANIGPHSLCISKALGWQNEDGSVNKAHFQARATAIFGEDPNLQSIIDECAVSKDTEEATAINIFKCYKKHAPHHHGEHGSSESE